MHRANNLRHMFNPADSLYIVMLKAQGSSLLAISVLLQACNAAGLSNAAAQLVWATDGSSKTGMHDDNFQHFCDDDFVCLCCHFVCFVC